MSLTFFPTTEADETTVRQNVREFVRIKIKPTAIADDEAGKFRRELFAEVASHGWHSQTLPKEYGGLAQSHRCYYAFLEELARGSLAFCVAVSVTNLVQGALQMFGNAEQKEKYLTKLIRGEWLGAFSLSEPQSGSDASALTLSAKNVTGGYRLQGSKMWCSNAGDADIYLVMARTAVDKTKGISAFLVPRETSGMRFGKQEKKLGLKASGLAEVFFEDCFIPSAQRLGTEGEGYAIALSQLDSGRVAIGVAGMGAAIETIERTWKSFSDRGHGYFADGLRDIFSEHYAYAQALKALVAQAASLKDRAVPLKTLASQIKLIGSDLAMRVTSDAVHYLGEEGYLRNFEIERFFRDAKALQIVEGTNQIQKLVLARAIDAMIRES